MCYDRGMPMLLMGDEVRLTQGGNNNAYCQDNEISWFDWSLVEKHADVLRFVKVLIARRTLRAVEHEHNRVSLTDFIAQSRHTWHGVRLRTPDWSDSALLVVLEAELRAENLSFHLILNAHWEPHEVELPKCEDGHPWRRWIDTSLDSPEDIVPWQTAPAVTTETYPVNARSVVMLFANGLTH